MIHEPAGEILASATDRSESVDQIMPLTLSARGRLLVAALACLAGIAVFVSLPSIISGPGLRANWGLDFSVYWEAGRAVLAGHSPYGATIELCDQSGIGCAGFRYPPPFALLIAPFSLLPLVTAKWAWLVISFGALLGGAFAAARAGGAKASLELALWLSAGLLIFTPVFESLWVGNFEGVEVLLIGLALYGGASTGLLTTGAAAILKVVPATFVPAALARNPKAAWRALALLGTVLLVSLPLAWPAWRAYPNFLLDQFGSVRSLANFAPANVLVMLFPGIPFLASLAEGLSLLLALGFLLISIRWARRPAGWPGALFAGLLSGLLISPLIWYHYLALLLPFVIYAWPRLPRTKRLLMLLLLYLLNLCLAFPFLVLIAGPWLAAWLLRLLRPGRTDADAGLAAAPD